MRGKGRDKEEKWRTTEWKLNIIIVHITMRVVAFNVGVQAASCKVTANVGSYKHK